MPETGITWRYASVLTVWMCEPRTRNDNKTERFIVILEIPPVELSETAVKMAIYSNIEKGKIKPSENPAK